MLATAWRTVAIVMLGLATTQARALDYSLTTISVPGATSVSLWDINNLGQIVGYATFGTAESGTTDHAFLLDRNTLTMTPFSGPSNALETSLNGISDSGTLVGSYTIAREANPDSGLLLPVDRAFVYDGNSFETLLPAGASRSQARGISPDGRYVSGMYAHEGGWGWFVYDRTINDFVLARDTFQGIVNGANSSGIIVGNEVELTEFDFVRTIFRYDIGSGTFTDYAGPEGEWVSPRAISDDGVVAGWLRQGDLTLSFIDRGASIDYIALAGARMTQLEGINDAGWFVGIAEVNGVTTGVIGAPIAVPVPEPSTYALLALGLGAVCLRARTRRQGRH